MNVELLNDVLKDLYCIYAQAENSLKSFVNGVLKPGTIVKISQYGVYGIVDTYWDISHSGQIEILLENSEVDAGDLSGVRIRSFSLSEIELTTDEVPWIKRYREEQAAWINRPTKVFDSEEKEYTMVERCNPLTGEILYLEIAKNGFGYSIKSITAPLPLRIEKLTNEQSK